MDVLVVSSSSMASDVGALHRASAVLLCFLCAHDILKFITSQFFFYSEKSCSCRACGAGRHLTGRYGGDK